MAENVRFIDGYLLYLLAQASSAASAEFHEEVRRRGVSVAHWRVLAALKGADGLTIGELAEICLANQPAMSKTVERMVNGGLVERRTDADDRRRVKVMLTREGEARADELINAAMAHQGRLVAALGGREKDILVKALTGVIERSKRG